MVDFSKFRSRSMGSAAIVLNNLVSRHRGSDFDWEAILEFNYCTLLGGRADLGIIDIGGHAGRHTAAMLSNLNPRFVAVFEPLPFQFEHLETTFGNDARVRLFNKALSTRRGQSTFIVEIGAPEESGLRQRSHYNDGRTDDLKTISVAVERLDDLSLPGTVHFIKIDTEGAEMSILRGAKSLIGKNRPIISVEYGIGAYDAYGHKPTTIFNFATLRDYSLFDLLGNQILSREEWKAIVDRFYWDFIMIPDEKIEGLADRIALIKAVDVDRFLR